MRDVYECCVWAKASVAALGLTAVLTMTNKQPLGYISHQHQYYFITKDKLCPQRFSSVTSDRMAPGLLLIIDIHEGYSTRIIVKWFHVLQSIFESKIYSNRYMIFIKEQSIRIKIIKKQQQQIIGRKKTPFAGVYGLSSPYIQFLRRAANFNAGNIGVYDDKSPDGCILRLLPHRSDPAR